MSDIQEQPTAENVFEKELALISNFEVRYFVTQCFGQLCPNYFWYIPASQRGHHIPVCRTIGGLVHHIKLAVKFAHSFMEMWPNAPETSYDEVIAAVLMHDMLKRGEAEDELVTFESHEQASATHGLYCARQIEKLWQAEYRGLLPEDRAKRIITAVRDHMGRWTNGFVRKQDDIVRNTQEGHIVCITTHLADYAASRSLHKWIGERYNDESMGYLNA